MNAKKQYTAPTLEVVDVEVHLMLNGASADGEKITFNYESTDPDDTLGDNEEIY